VLDTLYRAFLSEDPAAPEAIHGHVRAVMAGGREAAANPLCEATWTVERLAKRTGREVHRMHAFVRFEQAEGGVYAATVEPACDVLPLIGDFFRARFASQPWAIYDARRGYGLYYDLEAVRVVDAVPLAEASVPSEAAPEERYQALWRTYFEAVDIPERRNLRLQLRHMPRRYWKHLTELRP
jgi:probable DNA metabolism protein